MKKILAPDKKRGELGLFRLADKLRVEVIVNLDQVLFTLGIVISATCDLGNLLEWWPHPTACEVKNH